MGVGVRRVQWSNEAAIGVVLGEAYGVGFYVCGVQ